MRALTPAEYRELDIAVGEERDAFDIRLVDRLIHEGLLVVEFDDGRVRMVTRTARGRIAVNVHRAYLASAVLA